MVTRKELKQRLKTLQDQWHLKEGHLTAKEDRHHDLMNAVNRTYRVDCAAAVQRREELRGEIEDLVEACQVLRNEIGALEDEIIEVQNALRSMN